LSLTRLGPDAAAVRLGEPARDRQAKTGAANAAVAATLERLEDPLTIGSRNARAAVDDAHQYELLRLFALNEGKLLTHRTLLQEVWGPGYDGAANLLHVNVSQLRRKIEPDRARPRYLLTEAGAGYRLVNPATQG